MQSCYTYIIDACNLTSHLLGYECGFLCYRDIGCTSTDYANMSSRATMNIARFVDDYCASVWSNSHAIRFKHFTQRLHDFWLNSTDNRSTSVRQDFAGHCNYLPYVFCLAKYDFRHPFALLALRIETNFDYR